MLTAALRCGSPWTCIANKHNASASTFSSFLMGLSHGSHHNLSAHRAMGGALPHPCACSTASRASTTLKPSKDATPRANPVTEASWSGASGPGGRVGKPCGAARPTLDAALVRLAGWPLEHDVPSLSLSLSLSLALSFSMSTERNCKHHCDSVRDMDIYSNKGGMWGVPTGKATESTTKAIGYARDGMGETQPKVLPHPVWVAPTMSQLLSATGHPGGERDPKSASTKPLP